MEIKSNHIKESEAILINGNSFDEEERVPFIKNLNTCDLLAVPGSGKTTALQSKLYCLARQMPFEDRSGILVLSHTNKAVEEIEKKLKNHCPQLFEYPNFVGTVQGFVNRFLANPGCMNQYGSYIHINDNDIYEDAMKKIYLSLPWKPNNSNDKFLKNDLYRRANYKKDISSVKKEKNTIKYLCDLKLDIKNNKICYGSKDTTIYKLGGKTDLFFVFIRDQKFNLFSQGVTSFSDSYRIANEYTEIHQSVKRILYERFRYIFMDEAQDLEKYQLDIIESIFNSEGSNCVIQRIGDINQSIYNSSKTIKVECDWKPRNPLHLKTSLRLTKEVADVVDYFTLENQLEQENSNTHQFKVDGKNNIGQIIKPHLIIFDNNTKEQLKPKFEELIRQFNLFDGSKGKNSKRGYKIIGWSGTWKEEDSKGKLRLENIFHDEYKVANIYKATKIKLSDYLVHNLQVKTLKKYQDDIIDALCTLLRSVECKAKVTRKRQELERYYTSQILWKYLLDESRKTDGKLSEQDLLDFKSKLYTWSFSVATNNSIENTYSEIKSFINDTFANWLGFNIEDNVDAFTGTKYENIIPQDTNTEPNISDDIPIEICSVHSVKGQTHCATMYVETSYYHYETEKKQVINALKKEMHSLGSSTNVKRSIEAFKMMYVGFSRPTHLLCFAIFVDEHTVKDLAYFKSGDSGWSVVDLT